MRSVIQRFTSPRLRRRLALGLGVTAGVSAITLALSFTTPMQVAEAKTYDLRTQWLADPAAADSSIVILAIDENSLDIYGDELGRWPWDRDAYNPLLRYAAAGGARAVVMDLTFPEPDRRYPLGDTLFAEAMLEAGNTILAFTLTPGDSAQAADWRGNRLAEDTLGSVAAADALLEGNAVGRIGEELPEDVLDDFWYAEPPYALLGAAAHSLGAINWTPDPDGVSRRQRLLLEHRDRVQPSLPLAAARLLAPDRYRGAPRRSEDGVRFGETEVPLHDGRFLIDWHGSYLSGGSSTYRIIPAFHVLDSWEAVMTGYEPAIALEEFEGKIVFLAATAVGAFEVRPTPLGANEPGVLIHAAMLDNLLNGDFLRRAPFAANAGLLLGTALLAALLTVLFGSAVTATIGAMLTLVAAGGLSTWALASGVWLDMAAPLFAGALAFSGVMVGNYLTEGREKRRVRDLFGRYVSPEYVSQLADNYQNVKLGGERVPVTLLFSDIRGFTSLSERLDPEVVIEMLNEYLDRMAEVVFRHGGTLDKFIGDAVMAFWNAPVPVEDHARRAVEAALDMMEELAALNERWEERGAPARLQIGIGVNTGEAIVGNIGSLTRKLDYTAIGDAVNLAARLESATKEYGASIIVSEATKDELAEGAYALRSIEEVKVKGKEKAVRIFELEGRTSAGTPGRKAGLVTASLLGALLATSAAPAVAQDQERARWTDWVYRPGAWQGGQVAEHATTDTATDSLALVARVDLYTIPPRWRAEFREVVNPDSLAPPVVLVVDGENRVILTQLGSTPLERHRAAEDPVVQAILERVEAGIAVPPGPARIVEIADGGRVQYVIDRRPAARVEFDDALVSTGTAGRLGRSMARLGMHAIGGERDQEVVASAGARGVARVQTVDGEITVMPDTAGILAIQRVRVGIIDVDRFLREAGVRAIPLERPRQEEGER